MGENYCMSCAFLSKDKSGHASVDSGERLSFISQMRDKETRSLSPYFCYKTGEQLRVGLLAIKSCPLYREQVSGLSPAEIATFSLKLENNARDWIDAEFRAWAKRSSKLNLILGSVCVLLAVVCIVLTLLLML